jgi:hypothetical protein
MELCTLAGEKSADVLLETSKSFITEGLNMTLDLKIRDAPKEIT